MNDALYGLLGREWGGLVLAAAATLLALGGLHLMSVQDDNLRHGLALLIAGLGAVPALAALRHLVKRARTVRRLPPPGRRVDIGGYALHVLAEGEARNGRPPIVWFAGGHAGGFAMHHLHRIFRAETRSILIDRPGTGWSDTGPFPRTTAREAAEVVRALERAGESGPFVWAGHSFGGLLCANVARRRPDLVHTLVLLDPTPLETLIFGPRFGAIRQMQHAALIGGLAQLFGIDLNERLRRQQAANPAYAKVLATVEAALGPEVAAVRALDARAGSHFATASIYAELSPEGAARCAWDTVVYDGDLGDLPVLLVAPKSDVDVNAVAEFATAAEDEAQRIARRLAATRERYLATSTRSQRVVTPPGTGHNFIYEVPDWLAGVMRAVLHARN